MPTFAYSLDGEHFEGEYPSRAAALAAAKSAGPSESYWTGECVPPPQPESFVYAEDLIADVAEHYYEERAGGCEGWELISDEQQAELEAEIRAVLGAWCDRHDLRPKFFNLEDVQEHLGELPELPPEADVSERLREF